MANTLSHPVRPDHRLRRAAILFAGGPAPAANAVISTAAVSFLRAGIEVIGIRNGYSALVAGEPLQEGRDWMRIDHAVLRRTRASQGVLVGTARTNPGTRIDSPAHLDDPQRTAALRAVHAGLCSLEVDALVSIGGDDTLKSANKLELFQQRLPAGSKRIAIVHVPKTIDNDYMGIDFTFGYFTAVDTLAGEIRNLLHDAEATRGYFVAEAMGRSAGWLAYGSAIAGEASLVISVEDIVGEYRAAQHEERPAMDVDRVVGRIVKTMLAREREGKEFGVIVLAEGLAELLPQSLLEGVPRDEHGHVSISNIDLGKRFAALVAKAYEKATGRKRKVKGVQLGYEARCAKPHAFDVMLGSQLGVGAYRALVEKRLSAVMVSVSGQLELRYVPFAQLVDPQTLVTRVRYIDPDSDFHRLARFLETYVNE
jgi:6-phosphofructokinase 1